MNRRFTASSLHSSSSLNSSHMSQQSEVSDYSQESVHIPCQFQYGEEVVEYDELDPMLEGLEEEEIEELEFQVYGEGENLTPYLKPIPAHCPSMQPIPLAHLQVIPNPESFNERFQQLLETPPRDALNMAELRAKADQLVTEFVAAVLETVRTFVLELELPDNAKTLQAADLGGVAGGTKLLQDGIFYKFVNASNARIFGDAVYASKTYSAELRANNAILRAQCPNISVPLSAVVTFKGLTCYASCEVPLHEGSLIYGSRDTGRHMRTKNNARHWMAELCEKLHLKLHEVRGVHGLCCRMYGPMDIEGHESCSDGRFYLLDTARLFPCISWARAYRTAVRPECCRLSAVSLNSDAFSRFAQSAEVDEEQVQQACNAILEANLRPAVQTLNANPNAKISDVLHARGLCCHWLGRVAAMCAAEQATVALRSVHAELVARCFKTLLHRRLNKKYQAATYIPPEQEEEEKEKAAGASDQDSVKNPPEVIALRYFKNLTADPKFWKHLMRVMQTEYPDYDAPVPQSSMDEGRVMRRIEELTGFRLDKRKGGRHSVTCNPVIHVLDYKCRFQGEVPSPNVQEENLLRMLRARETVLGGLHPSLLPLLETLVTFYQERFPSPVGLAKAIHMQRRMHSILETLVLQSPQFDGKVLPKQLRQYNALRGRPSAQCPGTPAQSSSPSHSASMEDTPRNETPCDPPCEVKEEELAPVPEEWISGLHRPFCLPSLEAWQVQYVESAEQLVKLLMENHDTKSADHVVQSACFIAEVIYGKTHERYIGLRDNMCRAGHRSRTCCTM
eukprot:GGOE01042655.1.p1 GENE.GGOE01042655.1~~GGOE01042655.1.p1  ORF type:complete len:791 (-),score=256.36 GGOE01042655.1:331-2703(-)